MRRWFGVLENNTEELLQEPRFPQGLEEWRLFIDSFNISLKAALLHNANERPSVPPAHATNE